MTTAAAKNSKAADAKETAGEIIKQNGFSREELRGIASFEDVQKLFAEHEIQVVDAAEEIGDGFALADNKDAFIGREMMVLSWAFGEGDFKKEDGTKSEFVALRFVCRESNGSVGKYIITDGGVGIYQDLRDYTDKTGVTGGLYVKKGLRASRYSNEYTDDGVTHYLDLSK
jgi:hypothetical protein